MRKSILKTFSIAFVASVLAASAFFVSCSSDSDSHEHTFATAYTTNETHHWYAATCEHKDQIKDKAEHSFGEWNDGKRSCSACNYEQACEHSFCEWSITPPTEESDGSKKRECETCHYAEIEKISMLEHKHQISTGWTCDENYHWHAASCGREEHNAGKAAHNFVTSVKKAPTCTEKGINTETCSDCVYSKDVETALNLENHTGTTTWTRTATTHKETYDCCGAVKTEEAAHTWNDGEVTAKPTTETEGVKTFTCIVEGCGQTKTENIAKLGSIAKSGLTINGTEISKTSEVVVIPEGTVATIEMTDDSAWSGFVSSDTKKDYYKGVFLKNRKVKLSPFVMGQYPVTRDLYKAVMESDPSTAPSYETQGENPVNYVNWFDAIIFCNKLSALEGLEAVYSYNFSGTDETDPDKWSSDTRNLGGVPTSSTSQNYSNWRDKVKIDITKNGYRLPTEAEWEFAARGGDPTKADWKYAFSGVNVYGSNMVYGTTSLSTDSNLATVGWYGWYTNNSLTGTYGVGLKKANALNLYDMSGNVWEWCNDFSFYDSSATTNDSTYTKDGYVTDPLGASSGSYRVQRGGSWHDDANRCAVSFRGSSYPKDRYYYYGFRVCRSSSK